MTREGRFWAKVDKNGPGGCWPWLGAVRTGYGRFAVQQKRLVQAHRFAYELLVGPIPDGLELDHLCRNRACVNPDHMEPVTSRVNTLRGTSPAARNAVKTHCDAGHPLSPENTYVWNGQRACKTCRRSFTRSRRSDVEALLAPEPAAEVSP